MGAPIGRVGEFQVNGTPLPVYVNMNTLRKYIEYSGGDDFFQIAARLGEAQAELEKLRHSDEASDEEKSLADTKQAILAIKQIGWDRLFELCAAAFQRYKVDGEPEFIYSPGQLGGMLSYQDWQRLTPIVLQGVLQFMARTEDVPAVGVAKQEANPTVTAPPESDKNFGGPPSTPSDAAIADSLTMNSVDPPNEGSSSGTEPTSKVSAPTTSGP